MIQEDKELLLKDLCARLPYGVIIRKKISHNYQIEELNDIGYGQRTDEIYVNGYPIKYSKAYLRPISSMTEEEDKDWQFYKNRIAESCDELLKERITELHDWFCKKHFDFHNLIEKNLALEAPKNMYK